MVLATVRVGADQPVLAERRRPVDSDLDLDLDLLKDLLAIGAVETAITLESATRPEIPMAGIWGSLNQFKGLVCICVREMSWLYIQSMTSIV